MIWYVPAVPVGVDQVAPAAGVVYGMMVGEVLVLQSVSFAEVFAWMVGKENRLT